MVRERCAAPRVRLALQVCLLALSVVVLVGGRAAVASAANTSGDYIVVLKPSADERAVENGAKAGGATISQRYSHALNGFAGHMSDAQAVKLSADPRVLYVATDQTLTAATPPPAPVPPQQDQILPFPVQRLGGDQSSTRSGDGQGSVPPVNVAVMDSGIDLTHPDLNVVGGVNCTNGQGYADVFGHGTLVSGTLAAKDNAIGVVGVAPGARLWSVRVLNNQGNGSTSAILCGLDWVTATRTDNDPTNDIAVANASFGGKGSDDGNCGLTKKDPMHQAICAGTAAGVTYVAAAGNDSVDIQQAKPAGYDEVLTGTGIADSDGQPGGLGPSTWCLGDPDDSPASFSNYATLASDRSHTVAVVAECVASTVNGGLYGSGSGTSFAAPAVAGTVALCIASGRCASLTPAQIVQKIVADAAAYNTANPGYGFTGDPLRPISGKYYGYLARAGLY
jgi:subtilisin family serine protease